MNNALIEATGELIQTHAQILAYGGKTKTALQTTAEITELDMSGFSGVIEYEPGEYAFTAYAGTKLAEINHMLAENGQFLPFDPLFIDRGGTLGGTVAANMNGPGRYRYGGVRDFVLGVKYFDDQARLISFGGRVVKNAAGFDIPKLMVGSLGSFGALVELSFKVFPRPPEFTTAISSKPSLSSAIESLNRLTTCPIEIFCLDLEPDADGYHILIRLGGISNLFIDRIERLKEYAGDLEIMEIGEEQKYWENIRELQWLPGDSALVKIPLTPRILPKIDQFLKSNNTIRRYSAGANVAWVAWSQSLEILDHFLTQNELSGLVILGSTDPVHLGTWNLGEFYQRVKDALDPSGKWAEI
jgi:glycolate oxidase FAD binding subunit